MFPEVVVMDATYQTNKDRMPLINIMIVSNLGTTRLQNLLVASAMVVNEKRESYDWVLETLKNTVFPSGNVGLFVTDNEKALIGAITASFPDSKHILCGWHMEEHLHTNLSQCFPKKSDKINEIRICVRDMVYKRSKSKFDDALKKYRSLIEEAAISFAHENTKKKPEKKGKFKYIYERNR